MNSPKICFLCAPSLGILDSWLPVLAEIRRLEPKARISMVLGKRENVQEIDTGNVLLRIAAPLVDEILFPSLSGGWVRATGFEEALALYRSDPVCRLLQRVCNKLGGRCPGRAAAWILGAWARLRGIDNAMPPRQRAEVFNEMDAVLFDIHEEKKGYLRPLLRELSDRPKFSLCHGIDIKVKLDPVSGGEGMREGGIRVLLYSERERAYYKTAFNLTDDELQVLGIPRHEPDWVRRIVDSDERSEPFPESGYIFVISRPGGSSYFPEDRRLQALEDIRRLAFDVLKLKVVVKLHPKERWDGDYERIFGAENYGRNWIYSTAHPFSIAKGALFAVAFYSGVPSDMTAMGVPTVELLNLRGLEEWDNDASLRDEKGEPVLNIRHWGLVLGASDYEALEAWAEAIVRDRQAVVDGLQQRYRELFADTSAPSTTIARQVLEAARSRRSRNP